MAQKVRISLGFRKLNDQQFATLAGAVVKGMTGNKAFANLPVDLQVVETALEEYNASLAANVQGGTAATAAKNNKRDVLTGLLEKLGHYVGTHCNNDREILLSSGFTAVAPRAGTSLPEKPSIGSVDNGNTTQLVVRAGKVPRARFYELRSAAVDPKGTLSPWQDSGFFSKTRSMVVSNLTPGTNYAFQVRALGAGGFSDWSDPIVHVCW